jgi:glycosyltransferase involved in cell wall biosynthesis
MTKSASDATRDRKPGVLIVGNFLSASKGVRCVCEDLTDGLRSRGWRVATASNASNQGVRLAHMLASTWFRRPGYSVAQIDVYADRAFMYAEAVAASLSALHCPFVLTLHGGGLPMLAERQPKRVKRLLSSAAVVTAPSSYHQQGLCRFRSDIRIVRNGLDLSRYPARRLDCARPKLVWLRAFHETYNPLLAIEVLHRLVPRFPEVELLMVGPDKGDGTYQQVAERANTLNLQDHVRLVGAVLKKEVPNLLSTGDIFLNTTNIDNTPVTVVEAMACGLCVVSTDVGGVPHLLSHEQDSLLVPAGDADAMAAAIERIILDPALARRLSYNARIAAEPFDRQVVLDVWERLLWEVCAK